MSEFPRAVWLRSLRRALAHAPSDRLSYLGGHGVPELRTALATYLNRARGTAADPTDVVICTGFAQGLALAARAMRTLGARVVAVEDPSDPEYRTTLAPAGLESVAVPVDELGIRVDVLEDLDVDGVVITAAHQYPTGAVLPPDRRARLADWATRRRATIVEDDYDAEFRYDREPIGAIQGLCRDRVIYAGSASKILAPGLRLGWLISPPSMTEALIAAKQAADMGSAALDQLAFADVLERGELDHHLRRMRPIYRGRRDALLGALAAPPPRPSPGGRGGRACTSSRGCPTTRRDARRRGGGRGRHRDRRSRRPADRARSRRPHLRVRRHRRDARSNRACERLAGIVARMREPGPPGARPA